MDVRYIDTEEGLEEARSLIGGFSRIALDCEAAGFHRYDDRLSLVQLTAGHFTFLLDPLALELSAVLEPVLQDAGTGVVMHGADFDVRLLDRDLGISLAGLFDTQIAAALLGRNALGLSALLEEYFDVRMSKKYQRADWAKRPLPQGMRDYAAMDTLHLEPLADQLRDELEAMGRLHWAEEEFRELEKVRFSRPDDDEDPVLRVKQARDLDPRQVDRLREALAWRDDIARERDKALFRVVGDPVLVSVVQRELGTVDELADLQGMNGGLARSEGEDLLERLARIDRLPDEELRGYPSPPRGSGRGRPPPEVEETFRRIKEVRNRRAEELGIDRGTLLPNALLQLIAEETPADLDALSTLPGVRAWQVEAVGDAVLDSLRT
ncbi:MAG: ribonuclease D [Gemmatimonadales bacterium]|nr:MAG: ribonuclease D [Gemmatimonadales bacterium]